MDTTKKNTFVPMAHFRAAENFGGKTIINLFSGNNHDSGLKLYKKRYRPLKFATLNKESTVKSQLDNP